MKINKKSTIENMKRKIVRLDSHIKHKNNQMNLLQKDLDIVFNEIKKGCKKRINPINNNLICDGTNFCINCEYLVSEYKKLNALDLKYEK